MKETTMTPVILISLVVFVLIITWAVIYIQKHNQNRLAAGEKMADLLGATFSAEHHTPPDLGLDAFESMTLGEYPQIQNLLRGEIEGIRFDIFDFSTRVKSRGHNSRGQDLYVNHTVIALRIPNLALGRLRVRPQNAHATRARSEVQDIEVPSDLDFDRQFIVQGDQPDSVRQVLNEEVRTAIKQHPKRFVEVDGEQVLIFQQYKREPIESWLGLRDSALEVGLALMTAA